MIEVGGSIDGKTALNAPQKLSAGRPQLSMSAERFIEMLATRPCFAFALTLLAHQAVFFHMCELSNRNLSAMEFGAIPVSRFA
jgi:hypothetical protein